jgi:8-amino-7-oxononanoate synthase
LGLSAHPHVIAAAVEAVQRYGTGAGASRLVAGTRELHLKLERAIAHWQHSEQAMVFPSGFAANLAALSVFGSEHTTIFSDELNHASIIDGCRLAQARVQIYRHNDVGHLAGLMASHRGRKIVVTDTVFSMEGDVAPINAIAEICTHHDALLILDEAHAVLEDVSLFKNCAVLRVGTLSKTLGALGGWIAGSRSMIQLLTNRARSYVFTTGLSPADTAAALAALNVVNSEEGHRLRQQLRTLIDMLRPQHPSPIVPVILGSDSAALDGAATLLASGLFVPAIRPPTVPIGSARLRISLSALHTVEMVQHLKDSLEDIACTRAPRN